MALEKQTKPTLKDASVEEAIRIIASEGLEKLSLREVSRRLNVSHQAPYKHFGSRGGLLAAVIQRCLRQFATHLRQSGDGLEPEAAMRALGGAYLSYARENWLEYRLMFSTPWPDEAKTLGLNDDARAAFAVLCSRLGAIRPDLSGDALDREAMFVWSTMHGLAGVLESEAMDYLGLTEDQQMESVMHVFQCIDLVIKK